MTSTPIATELRVCFRDRLKNVDLKVGVDDVQEAKRIARIWAEKHEKESPTRMIFRRQVRFPKGLALVIDGKKVWPPPF